MKKHTLFALVFSAVMAAASSVFAACTTPTGTAGDMFYNIDQNVMQFCDGTDWWDMGQANPAAAAGSCTNPAAEEGSMFYNTSHNVMQFCNGESWINIGDRVWTAAAQTGCSTPTSTAGGLFYNTSVQKVQFCNGEQWVNAVHATLGGGAPAVDPNTLLLLTFDTDATTDTAAAAGSTTVTASPGIWTAGKNVLLSGNNTLTWTNTAALNPNTSAKTIEFWANYGDSNVRLMYFGGSVYATLAVVTSATDLTVYHSSTGGTWNLTQGISLTNKVWRHFAFTLDKDAGQIKLYVDGVLSLTMNTGTYYYNTSDYSMVGYMNTNDISVDDLTITEGVKYTANFTPPARSQ